MNVHTTPEESIDRDRGRDDEDPSRYPESPMAYFMGRGMMRSVMLWCMVAMVAALSLAAVSGVRVWGLFCAAMMVGMMLMMMLPSHRHHH